MPVRLYISALALMCGVSSATPAVGDSRLAATAVNELGLSLLRLHQACPGNFIISPYSIQSALVLAYAGADGVTREEMRQALGYPEDEQRVHEAFSALKAELADMAKRSEALAERDRRFGIEREPLHLSVANRLFGQEGYPFRPEFLEKLDRIHGAPFETCDFVRRHEEERARINSWIAGQTRDRIRDLIPPRGLTEFTRLVLVNTLYLKAAWMDPFEKEATAPEVFLIDGKNPEPVPTMRREDAIRYRRGEGYTAVALPYDRGDLQFVVFVPDDPAGLADLEKALNKEDLATIASAPRTLVRLLLPKFRVESPALPLGAMLKKLGMRSAFDEPPGSANFDRTAPRRPDDYLYISEVFHKTFIELDEKGTEAAAATAVVMMTATAAPALPREPIEVRVDRPFLFAIQHVSSGACLFLGRVCDPR